ncbi:hypothetical protein BDB01DRAFT_718384 [Pilobolus umbonatus]|nr:hypothetical protein BDB01DRAFT_718384 [Pilobolus umbonatus]
MRDPPRSTHGEIHPSVFVDPRIDYSKKAPITDIIQIQDDLNSFPSSSSSGSTGYNTTDIASITKTGIHDSSNSSFCTSSNNSSIYRKDYNDKWPVPETIEQAKLLCEKERLEGDAVSQLGLCVHLLESAYQIDPCNKNKAHSTEPEVPISPMGSGLLGGLMSSMKLTGSQSFVPTTLSEAFVLEARTVLKHLATSSQNVGESGVAEAQYILGNCYGTAALGWPVDHSSAFQWYVQAAKHQHPEALYRAGVCCELGIGTEKDGARAISYFRKGAYLLHVPSMYKLGVIMLRGYCGNAISKRESIIWLQRAAMTPSISDAGVDLNLIGTDSEAALPHALHALAMVHLNKECENTSLIPDTVYAIKLLHKAAKRRYAPSLSKLGECYEYGHFCPEDEKRSIYYYTLAAQQNYPEAALALSGWYLTGSLKTKVLQQSDREAYLWAYKAAHLAKDIQPKSIAAKAYFTLGIFYENGIGITASIDIASRWYRKASRLGHVNATEWLSSRAK